MKLIKYLIIMIGLVYHFSIFAMDDAKIYTENKSTISVPADEPEFIIKLESNPTTGFAWFLSHYDKNLLIPVKHTFQAPTSQLVGAPGYELWTFRVKPAGFVVPQQTVIQFVYIRSWDASNQTKPLEFKVNTFSNVSTKPE